jgi:hypothetical protein
VRCSFAIAFQFALEYAFKKVQAGQTLNGTHQLLVYASVIGWKITHIIKKSMDANKMVGLEINAEKTKYTLLSRHQNAGQNHVIKIAN